VDCFGEHSLDAGFFVVSRNDDGHRNFGGEGERWEARGVRAGVWSCEGQFGGERRARRDIEVLENQEELIPRQEVLWKRRVTKRTPRMAVQMRINIPIWREIVIVLMTCGKSVVG